MVDDAAARYALIIEWSDEDRVYIATCPELPGCRTHGDSRAEALARGEEIIADDKGWAVPAPRIFDGWSNRPTVHPAPPPDPAR